jgi:hypothetical protein
MILVRTGGVLGVVIALLVAALFLFVVRPAINDTTQRAFDTADRMLDETSRQIDAIGTRDDPASFAAVVTEVKQELGPDAQLLDITFTEQGGNVKYRTGDSAAGYQWGPGRDGLEPAKVTLVGNGKLADNVFPIAKLDPTASAKLTAAAKAESGAGFELQSMTLAIDPATGNVRWTVTGEAGGRARVFTAKSDATGFKPVG